MVSKHFLHPKLRKKQEVLAWNNTLTDKEKKQTKRKNIP